MLKIYTAILFLIICPITFFAQDLVPVISNFSYEASQCRLKFSCYVKNVDDDNNAEANAFQIIIFNISDNSEIFSSDVQVNELQPMSSSASKSWTMDLPALAGYRSDVSYKIAVIANKNGKFEFDKKNNRAESAQFACGVKALNNAPAATKGGGDGESDPLKEQEQRHEEAMKSLAQDAIDMKATRDQIAADRKASQQLDKETLTSKVENLRVKVAKRTVERDQQTSGSTDWSDLSYEVADLELEKQMAEVELEKVTDEMAYGQEGMDKTEKERYKVKLEKLSAKQSELRKNQKNGIPFGQTAEDNTKKVVEEPVKEEKKAVTPKETVENKKSDKEKDKNDEDEDDKVTYLSVEQISQLSNFDLKKLKFDSNKKIMRRDMKLTTRSVFLSPEEKKVLQTEIDELKNQIVLAEAELLKRGETQE
jgi:hypothetical protein